MQKMLFVSSFQTYQFDWPHKLQMLFAQDQNEELRVEGMHEELLRLSLALRAVEAVAPRRNLCSFKVDSVYFVAPSEEEKGVS